MFDWKQDPHRRWNALTGEWVLVSPHRTQRPWQGQVEPGPAAVPPEYDPQCYLCPGNLRAGGARNPDYAHTFVFDNDFAALRPATPVERFDRGGLLIAESEPGICRVLCFSPRHNLTIAAMPPADLRKVVDAWVEQYLEIGSNPAIDYVQIFENRGAMMGTSNLHPHCQIWSNRTVPNEVLKEQASQAAWRERRGACLLCEYAELESSQRGRLVDENEDFLALVPFWAVWPFETMLVSRRHLSGIDGLSDTERNGLANILQRVTARYDRLFGVPFPYTMGFHQRPTDGAEHPEWHLHAHFYPPLLRSATVRKFMVGYEMLCAPQRDITPEDAAARLREL
jgi:UDPglucose--hexose-1-phosphate uridylyltransferase